MLGKIGHIPSVSAVAVNQDYIVAVCALFAVLYVIAVKPQSVKRIDIYVLAFAVKPRSGVRLCIGRFDAVEWVREVVNCGVDVSRRKIRLGVDDDVKHHISDKKCTEITY